MKHFVNDKIMSHFRSSKHKKNDESVGRSQADCSPEEGAIDPCKKPRPVVQRTCPGSETAPDNMYVLKNCDRCQDYTVQPCGKNCKCQKRKTNCSGQCEVAAREKSQAQSQESFPGTRKSIHKMTGKPSKTSFNSESQRRMGGMGPICQLCGLEEIRQPGQSMCPVCSEKIQAAVDNYYVQCQGQCQQGTGQPCPYQQNNNQFQQGTGETCPYEQQSQQQPAGEWQQLQGSPLGNQQQPLGDQPFNIIVLQDCNNSSLIDQLTTAINRGGGQVHVPQQYSDYNYQNPNQQYNPLSGYIDYEYVDYQQRFDQERMDRNGYRNGMSPWSTSSRDAYEDEHMSCNSYDCPARMPENYQRQGPFNEPRSDNSNQSYANSCTCNCDFCRKGFETKEKLAMLIAQALEIFIGNNKAKAKGSEMKPKKEKEKEKGKANPGKKRKPNKSKSPRLKEEKSAKSSPVINSPALKASPKSDTKMISKADSKVIPKAESKINFTENDSSNVKKEVMHPFSREPSQFHASTIDSQSVESRPKYKPNSDDEKSGFFLPNCEQHRCKHNCKGKCSRPPHNCKKGCKDYCRGPCSKSGAGDGRSRSKGSKNQIHNQRHTRCCGLCNQGEGRKWQEVSRESGLAANGQRGGEGIATGAAGCPSCRNDRSAGGGRTSLLGLSPIAHYRPGMLQFPVNYLLAGTNFRRSLVRTAAGVTLHQKPYVDMASTKDLPHFPCRKKSSSPDCRTPRKKWL